MVDVEETVKGVVVVEIVVEELLVVVVVVSAERQLKMLWFAFYYKNLLVSKC